MRRPIPFIVFSIMAMGLAACQPPKKPQYEDITFTHLPPYEFDVAEIIIKTPYQEPLEAPHVGEQFPVSPSRAARRWAGDRLRAVGSSGTLTVTIVESSATETELARTKGVTGILTRDQAQSYEVTIEIIVEVFQPVGPRTGKAEARSTKSVTAAENITMNDRRDIWYKLTKDTMTSFNATMGKQIDKYLAKFIK